LTYRRLLSVNPDFRRLWFGQVVSEIGDWLNNIAVLALTIQAAGAGREGLAISLYAIARHLPLFVFGPIAGVVVDRADRRRVMIVADLARAALALGLLLAGVLRPLPVVYVVGALLFSVSAFFNAAKRASIPNIVRGPDQLLAANSLSASTTAATIAVGSALGGVVATFVGRNTVFVLNAVTFLISAEMIRRVRSATRKGGITSEAACSRQTPPPSSGISEDERASTHGTGESGVAQEQSHHRSSPPLKRAFSEFTEGLKYVRNYNVLSAVFVVAAGWGLGNGVARALYSIFGARLGLAGAPGFVTRPTDFGISVLFVAMGIGGVLGAPIAKRFNSGAGESLGNRMGRSMFLDGCGLVAFSFMPSLMGASLVLIAREANFAIWWTAQQTIIMRSTDDRFSGRVFASFETLTTLMMVASILVAGLAADRFGIRPVAAVGGAVIAFSGLLWFFLRKDPRRVVSDFR
jgi:MFS family permease